MWALCVRMAWAYHCTWFVNSATHLWGYRNYETRDESRNLWWVALLAFGEGWHNNHHAHPHAARPDIAGGKSIRPGGSSAASAPWAWPRKSTIAFRKSAPNRTERCRRLVVQRLGRPGSAFRDPSASRSQRRLCLPSLVVRALNADGRQSLSAGLLHLAPLAECGGAQYEAHPANSTEVSRGALGRLLASIT